MWTHPKIEYILGHKESCKKIPVDIMQTTFFICSIIQLLIIYENIKRKEKKPNPCVWKLKALLNKSCLK